MSVNTIVALAGRRVDSSTSKIVRFPLDHIQDVRIALLAVLRKHNVTKIICSAACGADLLALDVARQLGVSRYIILPFSVDAFRISSVIDRPGNWGELYDSLVVEAKETANLLIMDGRPGDKNAYSRTTHEIIRQVAFDKRSHLAIVVWEGKSRGKGDATEEFRSLSVNAKFKQFVVPTY